MIACGLVALSEWSANRSDSAALSGRLADLVQRLDLAGALERVTYDFRMKLAAGMSPHVAPELGLVYADDKSIRDLEQGETLRGEYYGLFWPRYVFGRVLRELRAQGAMAVGFDIHFSDERFDHQALPVPWSTEPVDSDAFFAQELLNSTNTAVFLASVSNLPPAFKFRYPPTRLGDVISVRDVDGVTRQVAPFNDYHELVTPTLQGFARLRQLSIELDGRTIILRNLTTGAVSHHPIDGDGRIAVEIRPGVSRIYPAVENPRVWHLGVVVAAWKLGIDLGQAVIEPGRIRLRSRQGGERILPIDGGGRFLVDWATRTLSTNVFKESLETVLRSDVRRQQGETNLPAPWRNRLVFVGSLGTGNNVRDQGATPISPRDHLLGTYLNVANMLLLNRFVQRPAIGWRMGIVALLGVSVAWLNVRMPVERAALGSFLLGLVWFGFACWVFVQHRWWLPVVHPIIGGLGLVQGSLLLHRVLFEQSEKQRVRAVFSKIVSPDVVNELLEAKQIGLSGTRRQITVFFADVRGFTSLTDRSQAEAERYVQAHKLSGADAEKQFEVHAVEILNTVNQYLSVIANVIKQHRGTLDKYIGDCVMAFWGAPTPNLEHAAACVRAAIDAQRAIQRLNEERMRENERRLEDAGRRAESGEEPMPPLPVLMLGTGINSGAVTVGLMGSEAHLVNYTIFGREVNLASRLEGISGHGRIIIGETTYSELQRTAPDLAALCRAHEPVAVKGFQKAVPIYEVRWRLQSENPSDTVPLGEEEQVGKSNDSDANRG